MTDYESKLELTQAEYIELKREVGHGSVTEKEVRDEPEEWQKIVDRGPFVLPTYDSSRSAGELYSIDPETGELDLDDVVGYMPNTYYDKRYVDYYYYSFTAIIPDSEEIGCYSRGVFDEDDGTFDDAYANFEIEGSPLRFMTEKDFIANKYVYHRPDSKEVVE